MRRSAQEQFLRSYPHPSEKRKQHSMPFRWKHELAGDKRKKVIRDKIEDYLEQKKLQDEYPDMENIEETNNA